MGKTLQVMADRANDPTVMIGAGELLDLRYQDDKPALSLRAAKLLHVLVAAAGADACEVKEHNIPLAEINSFHLSREEFLSTARELMGTTVRLEGQNARGRPSTKMGVLLGFVEMDEDQDGVVAFELSKILRIVLKNSNHWAALSRQCVMAFQSRYALRLYEMITLRAGLVAKHSEEFTIDELRARLGVPVGKMAEWYDLNRFVLQRAILEVNQLSGLEVTAKPIKRSRSVVAVRLFWEPMNETERAAVARELAGHSAGRRARRGKSVETIIDAPEPLRLGPGSPLPEFPPFATIEGTGWDILVLHLVPEDKRSIDAINDLADQFRMWATRAKLPLTGTDIPARWTAFVLKKFSPDH
jgi:hypothetical protein